MNQLFHLNAVGADRRKRLEDFLFERFSGLSRMYLREIVSKGYCEVNGRLENVGYKLRPGDFIEVALDPSRENAMQPEEMPLRVVYEDECLIVVDKPAGMLVHPTHRDKNGTLLNGVVHYLNRDRNAGPAVRPGLVHRLDKETSGLIMIAKDVRSHRILAKAFQRRQISKRYVALVHGAVAKEEFLIEAPVGRFADKKFWDVKEDGKPSVSRCRVIQRRGGETLIELEPITGRTNQLRIHCAFIGHPIVGDVERGGSPHDRLCLHAGGLEFRQPATGEWLALRSPASFTSPVQQEI